MSSLHLFYSCLPADLLGWNIPFILWTLWCTMWCVCGAEILRNHVVAVRLFLTKYACFKGTQIPFVVAQLIILGIVSSLDKKDVIGVRETIIWCTSIGGLAISNSNTWGRYSYTTAAEKESQRWWNHCFMHSYFFQLSVLMRGTCTQLFSGPWIGAVAVFIEWNKNIAPKWQSALWRSYWWCTFLLFFL